jgi:hypothetical protein
VLESVASFDTWIWHANIGMPGSNNDINILDRSPLMSKIMLNDLPQFAFQVNGTRYNLVYFLADGIYPEWPVFVKSISVESGSTRPRRSVVKLQIECIIDGRGGGT